MLSISHFSIFYVSMDRFTSHQRREKKSQFSKKFDPQIRNFRKKHTIILTSMTYPSQFFFFFSLELNPSIEFPPKLVLGGINPAGFIYLSAAVQIRRVGGGGGGGNIDEFFSPPSVSV